MSKNCIKKMLYLYMLKQKLFFIKISKLKFFQNITEKIKYAIILMSYYVEKNILKLLDK